MKLTRKQVIAIKAKYPKSLTNKIDGKKSYLEVHNLNNHAVTGNHDNNLLVVDSSGRSDFPIHYGNGRMGYDNYQTKYIQNEIKKLHKIN